MEYGSPSKITNTDDDIDTTEGRKKRDAQKIIK